MDNSRKDAVLVALDETIAEHVNEAERLRRLRQEYIGPSRRRTTSPRKTRSSAAKSAGPAAIAKVEEVLARVGRTPQSEIARETGLNSGTVSHALSVLETGGKAQRTGRLYRRSPEWAAVAVPVANPDSEIVAA